jgi:hypothetical protein
VRNSLLVEDSCADNERDLSILPKQRISQGKSKKEKGKSGSDPTISKEKNTLACSEPERLEGSVTSFCLFPFYFFLVKW